MAVDRLSDALNVIKTHEMVGKRECEIPASKLIGAVLEVFKKNKYIEDYEFIDNGRGGYYKVKLAGRINNCGVIKPRFSVKRTEWPLYEQQYIPAVGVGLLVVTTPKGIMSNIDAQREKIGGRLLAYVY